MLKQYIHIVFLFTSILLTGVAFSQKGFYVPANGNVFFKGDTATIFSNVINEGRLGIGQRAVLNFSGQIWSNSSSSSISEEATAPTGLTNNIGLLRFLSTSLRQQIDGGYNAAARTGPMFKNLQLQNPYGVELINSSTKIERLVDLQTGLFYLNDQLLIVGNNNPGNIKGYDSSRYFVTQRNGGLLIREGIRNNHGWVTFPVGSRAGSYTPVALRSLYELPDDFYAAVFDSVFINATSGSALMNESVGKTWQIGKRFLPGQGEVEIALQHLNKDEGNIFSRNKSKAYISQYTNGSWDVSYPQTYPGTGYITTGAALTNSGANSRLFASIGGATAFFTKLTGAGDTSRTRFWFNAYRLDPANVKVYWSTLPEINVKRFVVQRRLANELNFRAIDTVNSIALNGYSRDVLDYAINDANSYTGISFYRLLAVTYSADSSYSQIIAVGNKAGVFQSEIWPNPTSGVFNISLNTEQPATKLVIWNALGQEVLVQKTNGARVMQVNARQLTQGNYYVSIYGLFNTILETKKLIIVR